MKDCLNTNQSKTLEWFIEHNFYLIENLVVGWGQHKYLINKDPKQQC
jgi:hypothetical protein